MRREAFRRWGKEYASNNDFVTHIVVEILYIYTRTRQECDSL